MKQKWYIFFISLLLLAAMVLAGCQAGQPETASAKVVSATTVPETAVAAPEIPAVRIDINDSEIIIPDNFPGGIVAVTVHNSSSKDLDVSFARVREGHTSDEIIQLAEGDMEANFVPLSQAASFMGSFNPVAAGSQENIIMDFRTGEFIVDATEHSEAEPIPGALHLLAAFKADKVVGTVEPEADVAVELHDFAFVMPSEIKAGKQLWEFNNKGSQWHMMFVVKPNPDVSAEAVLAALQEEGEPSGPSPFEFVGNVGTPPLGEGERIWLEYSLEPGSYLVACPLPDMAAMMTGEMPMSHLEHGMHSELTVKN